VVPDDCGQKKSGWRGPVALGVSRGGKPYLPGPSGPSRAQYTSARVTYNICRLPFGRVVPSTAEIGRTLAQRARGCEVTNVSLACPISGKYHQWAPRKARVHGATDLAGAAPGARREQVKTEGAARTARRGWSSAGGMASFCVT